MKRAVLLLCAVGVCGCGPRAPLPAQPAGEQARSSYATSTSPTVTASPAPSAGGAAPAAAPEKGNAPSPSGPAWLVRINHYRAMTKLPPLTEDLALSEANLKHARYLMENYAEQLRSGENLGAAGHDEQMGKPFYTAEGAAAARNGEAAWGCGPLEPEREIDRQVAGPFHRLSVLDPDLKLAGFGTYHKDGCWAAVLRLPTIQGPPADFDPPVAFPPSSASVSLKWAPGEFPEPLAGCPDYGEPVGLPITLELGRLGALEVSGHAITKDGAQVEHCILDAPNYANPDPAAQEYGRWLLKRYRAIVLIPRAPLAPGTYRASITAQKRTYAWSFTIEAEAGETSSR